MGKFETANLLAIVAAGRNPQWVEQTAYEDPPTSASDGTYLEEAVVTLVRVDLRETLSARTAYFVIDAVDLTAVYELVLDGTSVTYDAGGAGATDLDDVLAGIVAAVQGNVTTNALVNVTVVDTDDDGVDDAVRIEGRAIDDYTLDYSTTGTPTVRVLADPATASIRFYATVAGTGTKPDGWVQPYDANYPIAFRGFIERFETAGLDRGYVEVYDMACAGDGASVTYTATVTLGPCVVE